MLLALVWPAIGCHTTAVNFVVTDGQLNDAGLDVPDGTAVPDGITVVDADAATGVASDAVMADVANVDGSGDATTRPSDLDAQIDDAGMPAFAVGAPVSGPARYIEYKCCTSPTGACFIGYQGSDTTCRDEATWTDYANAACQDQGRIMLSLGMYVGC